METPICNFVRKYAESGALRLHMPGHKGSGFLGFESLDITEIGGADSLYEANGIIKQSEKNAGELFGCETFYSAEGSSLCIRAMLYLVCLRAAEQGRKPRVAAARNVHKTFLSAAALLGFEVDWLHPETGSSYLSCTVSPEHLQSYLENAEEKPIAVYITSPDYLGNTAPLKELSAVCHSFDVLLLVDNAHGAYLRFLPESLHPIDLGADICCDSAHKTLPVITGGAYLHISPSAPEIFSKMAKKALALFGSTSPSYLILQSLDMANKYLAGEYPQKLAEFCFVLDSCKEQIKAHGFELYGDEPLKICIAPKSMGYTGTELASMLEEVNIISEFSDPDHIVFMFTGENGREGAERLTRALLSVKRGPAISEKAPAYSIPEKVFSIRSAVLSPCEEIEVSESHGRVLALSSVGCPPAVPILVCGERVDEKAVECFKYYGIEKITVIK